MKFKIGDRVMVSNNVIQFVVTGFDPIQQAYDVKMVDTNVVITVAEEVLRRA